MAELLITRKDASVWTVLVDDEDLPRIIAAGPWFLRQHAASSTTRVQRHVYTASGVRSTQALHQFILQSPESHIDHINCNGLDNRKSNLRLATQAENMRNRKRQKNNTSGYKGVRKARKGWRAAIDHEGVKYQLGTFSTAETAHAAYCAAAQRLHGSFARTE